MSLSVEGASTAAVGHQPVASTAHGTDKGASNEASLAALFPDDIDGLVHLYCGDPLGDFGRLPPEVRAMIWKFLFSFPRPIVLITQDLLSSHQQHQRLCPINEHRRSGDVLRCIDRFDSANIGFYTAPKSVLEISFASKELRMECVPVFFGQNNILFTCADTLSSFESEKRHYFNMDRSLTIVWSKYFCSIDTINSLCRMPALENLAIDIHYEKAKLNAGGTLRIARGMSQLASLRGIKTLKLVGTDRKRDANGNWQDIDIEDKAALGPWLREQVTGPNLGLAQ
ncbi:MAG: hypothetical protein Q9221_001715 [Calogaya cf. arnoldii]